MSDKLILGVPSKGRLMEQTAEAFAAAGLTLRKTGNERGYRGEVVGFPDIEVAFISASEIAWYLKTGRVHLGVTGEDLVSEQMSDAASRVTFLKKLGFGRADVVVAVPDCWIDVRTMADLAEIALPFRRAHGRWYRVATKYLNITRRFFAAKGLSDYRIVESLGATEGTPAAGTAQTSERWLIAGAASPVATSTVRRAFGMVEIGFIAARTRSTSPVDMPPSVPPDLPDVRSRPVAPATISS